MSESSATESTIEGTWVTPKVSYVEPLRNACALCGQPIPRKYWQATIDGKTRIFCTPTHAEMYVSYWIPTHGG